VRHRRPGLRACGGLVPLARLSPSHSVPLAAFPQ
jgi:hypothetical protein